ncbi:MAG TPA: hypothetical protein VGE05_11445 [Novosphingobium sp.]
MKKALSFRHVWLPALCLMAAGCSSAPQGQVAATIDGEEVTQRELLTELEAEGVGGALQLDTSRQAAALERIIDRKLLAAAARTALIDRSPDFQIAALAEREQLLARMLLRRSADLVPSPTAADIARRIADQPWRYGERTAMLVERDDGKPVGGTFVIDSASLSQETARRLREAGSGAKVNLMEQGRPLTLIVRKRWSLGMTSDEQARQAAADLRSEAIATTERQLIAALRARAAIQHQKLGSDPANPSGGLPPPRR